MTADTFGPWPWPSPMVDRLGDLRRHTTSDGRFGFVVDEPKLNGRGRLHAGALSTIADVVIGHTLSTLAPGDSRFVTTALEIHFLGAGQPGDWIDIAVTPVRIGKRLAIGTATFTNDGRTISFATATFMPA
jgi:acyl-coenzyme A thioesterase PaaI-like protein